MEEVLNIGTVDTVYECGGLYRGHGILTLLSC